MVEGFIQNYILPNPNLASSLCYAVVNVRSAEAQRLSTITGVYGAEVPPVPIPNTEVKLSRAESTWLDTAREDMSMPVSKKSSFV